MPFEMYTDFQTMADTTSPPSRSSFRSILRGIEEISVDEYNIFLLMWQELGCRSLLDMTNLYAVADVTLYAGSLCS